VESKTHTGLGFSLEEVLKFTSGRLVSGAGPHHFSRVGTDSRKVFAGELFIALKGENFDGHQFVLQALEAGALGAIVAKPLEGEVPKDKVVIEVDDTLQALQRLAGYHRSRFQIPVVAITGTAGKTTTKNMIGAILSSKFKTMVNPGNINNEFGVPLNLLSITPQHQVVVLELGMNHPGEVAQFTSLVAPDVGVATNVGLGHIGFFESIEEIAREKGSLFTALPEDGYAILNYDDERVRAFSTPAHRVTYGIGKGAQVRPEKVFDKGLAGIEFVLEGVTFHLPIFGIYNLHNALAALAVGYSLGLAWSQMAPALAGAPSEPLRGDQEEICGITVINSAYNANPLSLTSAINWLATLPTKGRRILLLGDMLELGDTAPQLHREIGALVARLWREGKLYALLTVGDLGGYITSGAWEAGMSRDLALHHGSREDVVEMLTEMLEEGDILLVKASRMMRLEELVVLLKERLEPS